MALSARRGRYNIFLFFFFSCHARCYTFHWRYRTWSRYTWRQKWVFCTKRRRWPVAVVVYSSPVLHRTVCQGRGFLFSRLLFLLPFFPVSREINVFPLSFVPAWFDVSDNEGIVDRPAKGLWYSERFISVYPAKRSFSESVFAGTSQSTVMVFRFPQRALGGKD